MTSSILRSNFNIIQKTTTPSTSNNVNTNNNGQRISKNPDLKTNYEINSKASNFIYNIKNAVMESKYFKNITNSDTTNNNNTNNNGYKNPSINNNVITNNSSASLALMNKIRAIESRKKRIPTSITITQPQTSSRGSGLNTNNTNNNYNNNSDDDSPFISRITPKPINSSTPAPQFSPMATSMEINKLRKKFNKSQLDSSVKNPDHFKDKVSDQKFFDRKFKPNNPATVPTTTTTTPLVQATSTPIPTNRSLEYLTNENHYKIRAASNIEPTKLQINLTSPNNSVNAYATTNAAVSAIVINPTPMVQSFNKLKLLKKRNLNKKLNSTPAASKSQSNLESIGNDFDEYNAEVTTNRLLDHHKSSQTIDEAYLYEIKNKQKLIENGKFSGSLNENNKNGLARSNVTINNHFTSNATPSTKAKSDNCLLELIDQRNEKNNFLPKFNNKNDLKIMPGSALNAQRLCKSNDRLLTKSKTELNLKGDDVYNNNDDDDDTSDSCLQHVVEVRAQESQMVNQKGVLNSNISVTIVDKTKVNTKPSANNNNEFRIIYPGCIEIPNVNEQQFDDNFINEEFKRLFQEDDYFKEVYRKCSEWMRKHVIPNMPKITSKFKKGHRMPS
jgi:hypothetical protein